MPLKSFGKIPYKEEMKGFLKSDNFKVDHFENIEPTAMRAKDVSWGEILKEYVNRPKSVKPKNELPNITTNLKEIAGEELTVVWFGHSSYLIVFKGYKILIDPVFSGNASPFPPFVKAFEGSNNYRASDFPEIDLLILTHDHYDHLDYKTIVEFNGKVKQIITSLGVGAHLEFWGIDKEIITEMDWWQTNKLSENIEITCTPARHFSGRGLKRGLSLWSSFSLKLFDKKIFIGGDSGYDKQFKIIGEYFGGFDVAFLECGQFGKGWPDIHMFPNEVAKAAKDLNAKVLLPVHWGKFILSTHTWNGPIRKLLEACEQMGQKLVVPKNGEAIEPMKEYDQKKWWNED